MSYRSRNLLLCFDAFGTLFVPKKRISVQYAEVAKQFGITVSADDVEKHFHRAFKNEARKYPNYGQAAGLASHKWWGNIIRSTFWPLLSNDQRVPPEMVHALLTRFSGTQGYRVYADVIPLFERLRIARATGRATKEWPWDRTVVGIISNSDDRVPGILESFGLKVGPRVHADNNNSIQLSTKIRSDDIDFVVLSYDIGSEKPAKQNWDFAEQTLQKALSSETDALSSEAPVFEKLYVGDEDKKDWLGAKKAGWNAILLDRAWQYADEAGTPEERADRMSIAEIPVPQWRTALPKDDRGVMPVIWNLRQLRHWQPPDFDLEPNHGM